MSLGIISNIILKYKLLKKSVKSLQVDLNTLESTSLQTRADLDTLESTSLQTRTDLDTLESTSLQTRTDLNTLKPKWYQTGEDITGNPSDANGTVLSMSADGNVIASAGTGYNSNTGYVRVYKWLGNWIQLGNDIIGDAVNDYFGSSLDLSGDGNVIAIGSPGNDDVGSSAGKVVVYKFDGTDWKKLGKDITSSQLINLGYSVSLSIDGKILAVGTPFPNSITNNGIVKVYKFDGENWNQLGNDLIGENNNDYFGFITDLSANGTVLSVGIPLNDQVENNSGKVKVYKWNGSNWLQHGQDILGSLINDNFGRHVSLSHDGNMIACSSVLKDSVGNNAGRVKVYKFNENVWVQLGSDINGKTSGDLFGLPIILSANGKTLAIGANRNDDAALDAGQVVVYRWNGDSWNNFGDSFNGNNAGDRLGMVSLSGDGLNLVISSYLNNNRSGIIKAYKYGIPF